MSCDMYTVPYSIPEYSRSNNYTRACTLRITQLEEFLIPLFAPSCQAEGEEERFQ